MAGIRVRGLQKSYRRPSGQEVPALGGVDMEIHEGEFVCLLGPSGCGKSTLLNILSGLDRTYQGAVEVTPRGGDAAGRSQPVIGYMFQESRLLPWLTVRENIRFVLDASRGPGETAHHIESWLTRVGLRGYEDYYPLQLSVGMQQRAAVARALIVEPELLLMDEPFSAVDELTGLHMRRELMELWADQGATVVFVTHNPLEAVYLADRVLLMTPGPGRIFEDIVVGPSLSRPRDFDDGRLWELSRRVVRRLMGGE